MNAPTQTVGLMADPGLAEDVARRIGEALAAQLSRDADERWAVDVSKETLPLAPDGDIHMAEVAPALLDRRGWDFVVYVTDLPRFRDREPILCEIRSRSRAALISLPALGAVRMRSRVRELVVTLVDAVAEDSEDPDAATIAADAGGTPVAAVPETEGDDMAPIVLRGRFRHLRLLLGMVRANRPGRLPRALSGGIAAAAASGAFGIFYGSIWTLSDALHPLRLFLIGLMVIAALTGWLIASNGLWNTQHDESVPIRTRLDNAATLITVALGVGLMYAALFAGMIVLGVVIVDASYLTSQLQHPVGPGDYIDLAWLSASLGTLAGALGSTFDNEDAIREATYSRRWYERRKLFDSYEEQEDDG